MTAGARVADAMVRAYQLFLRPLLPAVCRFEPSCSEYARLALASNGLFRGLGLAALRIARCHPFHPGGYDPPPGPAMKGRRG